MIKSFITYFFLLSIFISCSSKTIIHRSEINRVPSTLVVSSFDSLQQVPVEIRMKINAYLIAKVGQENKEKLSFVRGIKTESKSISEYKIIFQFSDIEAYLISYEFEILLDSYGNVITQVNLPSNTNNINKYSIISLDSATNVVNSNNCSFKEIDFDYLKDIDSFVWIFRNPGYPYSFWIFVNANTGEIVDHRIYDVWY